MAVSDELVEQARTNPVLAALQSIDDSLAAVEYAGGWDSDVLGLLIETYAFISELLKAGYISFSPTPVRITGDISESCSSLTDYLN